MTYKVMDNGVVRDATPEEILEIEERAMQETTPAVPHTVTRRQALQALLLDGHIDNVVPAIEANIVDPTERRMALIEWENSLEFLRDRPLVIQIGLALGLDAAGLDALFIKASTL